MADEKKSIEVTSREGLILYNALNQIMEQCSHKALCEECMKIVNLKERIRSTF